MSIEEKITLFANIDLNMRLDAVISKRVPRLSKNDANHLCACGKVKINGQANNVKAGQTLQIGDMVEVDFSELIFSARPDVGAKLLPLNIVFEDEHLLIINKPRKVHSVTLKESAADEATLADAIAAYCPSCVDASKNPLEAGLIQRLDYYTCGLIIAAKTRQCHKMLSLMMLNGQIHKTYLALVDGICTEPVGADVGAGLKTELRLTTNPAPSSARELTIKTALKSSGKTVSVIPLENTDRRGELLFARGGVTESANRRGVSHTPGGEGMGGNMIPGADDELLAIKETTVRFEKQIGPANTLVKASASAAYRHQIRAHLAFIGFPLTGDALYGSKETLATLGGADVQEFAELAQKYNLAAGNGYDGFFLCASELKLVHPITKANVGQTILAVRGPGGEGR